MPRRMRIVFFLMATSGGGPPHRVYLRYDLGRHLRLPVSGMEREKFSPKKMLAFYSERFNSTESNYTFRRMPSESTLANWAAQTPEQFRFSLKAPQEITHFKR